MKTKTPSPLIVIAAIVLGVAAIVASFQLDAPVRKQVVAAQGSNWKKSLDYKVTGAVRRFGDWPWLMAFGAAGALVAWKMKSRRWVRILTAAMVASTLAGMIANSARLTTGRTRPRESPKIEQGWYGLRHDGEWLVGKSRYNSFPSGHTATAFGFAGVILLASPLWGVLAMAAATWIAWSSIAIGAHHVSDVTVSTVISLVVAWLVWRAALARGDTVAAWIQSRFTKRRS